jgi:Transposase, Mutator family
MVSDGARLCAFSSIAAYCGGAFQRVALDEGVERQLGSDLRFGHPYLLQRAFGFRLLALRQLGEHVRGLVHPAALLEVMTGIGPVAVRQPRVRDREATATDPGRIRFSPSILPPYMRRSKSIETLLPILYLKGISTGDFSEALAALLGKDAAGLSASAIGRLKDGWFDEHAAWQKRDLSAKAVRRSVRRLNVSR